MELVILFVFTLMNGIFSMSEMAVVSSRKARLQQLIDDGAESAKIALALTDNPTRFLSTVQVAITLISILSGAFGEQAIAGNLRNTLITAFPALVDIAPTIATVITVAGTAYLSVVLGELVPKRFALQNPERIASLIAVPMNILSGLASPLVWILSHSALFIMRLLGIKESDESTVTEFEVMAMIEEATEKGVFHTSEQEMVEAIFELDERRIGSLTTPRTEMVWIDLEAPIDDFKRVIIEDKYSSYPVGRGNADNIVGIVQSKDMLAELLKGNEIDLETMMSEPFYIPEGVTVARAISMFKEQGIHTAVIVSEFGGVEGIVRMHDIIEHIFGELRNDENTPDDPDAVQREDGSWLLDGQYFIEDFKDHFPQFAIPDAEKGKYETIGGFVMFRLGRVPSAADTFSWEGLRFEVMDMDGVRIDKMLVQPIKPKDEDNAL